MAGTEDGFGVPGAVLELQPDQNRFPGLFQRGGHLGDISRGQRQSGRHQAAEFQKAATIDTLLLQGPRKRMIRREHGLTSFARLVGGGKRGGHRKTNLEVFPVVNYF